MYGQRNLRGLFEEKKEGKRNLKHYLEMSSYLNVPRVTEQITSKIHKELLN